MHPDFHFVEYYLLEILFGDLISIILGFFSSGIIFSNETVNKPFIYRIFNLGNLVLHSSDKTNPIITLKAVRNVEQLKNHL